MNLSEMTKEERQKHINLQTPCQTDKRGRYYRKALIEFSEINPGRSWYACHLCQNDSTSGTPCRNPLHMYWGKQSENMQDVCPKTGLTPGAKVRKSWKIRPAISDETYQKMYATRKGKKLTEEQKQKIRETWIRRKAEKLHSVTLTGVDDVADRSGG